MIFLIIGATSVAPQFIIELEVFGGDQSITLNELSASETSDSPGNDTDLEYEIGEKEPIFHSFTIIGLPKVLYTNVVGLLHSFNPTYTNSIFVPPLLA